MKSFLVEGKTSAWIFYQQILFLCGLLARLSLTFLNGFASIGSFAQLANARTSFGDVDSGLGL